MPAVLADLCIEARWFLPMTEPREVLEGHALVVRDGRILELLPSAAARQRYAPTVTVRRPAHLVMPGLINTATHAATTLFRAAGGGRAALEQRFLGPEFVRDGVLAGIAEMLRSGITCFADRYYFPDAAARAAGEQGMRAVIGLPVAETKSAWADTSADYLTRALGVRDEYNGHPLISTAFAPLGADTLNDAAFARLATLADELDARIVIDLHESAANIDACVARHGMRPIERLHRLGLLTPALNAVQMTEAGAGDIELARQTGISVSLCPHASLLNAHALPPMRAFAAAGIRLGVGSGGAPHQDLWGDLKLLAAMSGAGTDAGTDERTVDAPTDAWHALIVATRGGAAALGIDADVGTLEAGKWADLCCVDLGAAATQPLGNPVTALVFGGGRDIVSDVWVAGRQLVSEGAMTRLDWPSVAARSNAWGLRLRAGG